MKYNETLWLIGVACFCSAMAGFTQPMMGVIFGKVMNLLTVPPDVWEFLKGPDYLRDELDYWVLMSVAMAHICLFAMTIRGAGFGFIG